MGSGLPELDKTKIMEAKKMGVYQKIREIWKKPKENLGNIWKERLIKWRRGPSTVRVNKPTRLDRARSLGYKAKQGIFVVRQRLKKGGHVREKLKAGRRPRAYGTNKPLKQSYQTIAEQRVAKKYPNCEILNSYWVAQDGIFYWYEVIVVDKSHPAVKADKNLSWISGKAHKRRVFRGLTSSGKRARGLRKKGKGAEKLRPSRRKAAGY